MSRGESEKCGRNHGAGSCWQRLDPAALRQASPDASGGGPVCLHPARSGGKPVSGNILAGG